MSDDWFDGPGSGVPVDVVALWDSEAADLLWRCAAAGALVSTGTTSDGGAVSVTVTLDGRWRRGYFRSTEDLVDWLKGALAAVESTPRAGDASGGGRRRSRRS